MARRTPYPQEMKERAVRMFGEVRENYGNDYAAIKAVAARLGVGSPETVRNWLRRARVDGGERDEPTPFAKSLRLGVDYELRLHYEWDGSKNPVGNRHWGRLDAPPSHPAHQEQRGPHILFPLEEWEALRDADLEWAVYYANIMASIPVALEVVLAGPAAWVAVASVIRTYLTRHKDRKVVVYNDGKPLLEVSGDISVEEIESLLRTQLPSRTDPDVRDVGES
jgi:transposase-like protein